MRSGALYRVAAAAAKAARAVGSRYGDAHNTAFRSFRPAGAVRGRALLAHELEGLMLPADAPAPTGHNNLGEARAMRETLLRLGFAVDVISRERTRFRPRGRYDLFVAPRANFARIAAGLNPDCIKVAHLDTAHWLVNNAAIFARELALRDRRGVAIDSHKFIQINRAIETADYATLLGNDFDYASYAFAGKPVFQVPNPSAVLYPWDEGKDFAEARRRFLWIGSQGLVHKGLDLVLEAFARCPELHLTVCGPIDREPVFAAAFRRELFETPNIETLGWVDIASPAFAALRRRTAALVYPSCAEACCGTVVNSMQAGLIPIVGAGAGVDIDPGFGMVLGELSVEAVGQAVRSLAARPPADLAAMARRAWTVARDTYTVERYGEVFGAAIERIVDEHPKPSFAGFVRMPGSHRRDLGSRRTLRAG
jgi:glycosyltransferase involved in cell wall biosynthesis